MREGVRLRGGPGRCAYCHGATDEGERVACAACLAAHHDDCWRADGQCAACAHERALVPPRPPAASADSGSFLERRNGLLVLARPQGAENLLDVSQARRFLDVDTERFAQLEARLTPVSRKGATLYALHELEQLALALRREEEIENAPPSLWHVRLFVAIVVTLLLALLLAIVVL